LGELCDIKTKLRYANIIHVTNSQRFFGQDCLEFLQNHGLQNFKFTMASLPDIQIIVVGKHLSIENMFGLKTYPPPMGEHLWRMSNVDDNFSFLTGMEHVQVGHIVLNKDLHDDGLFTIDHLKRYKFHILDNVTMESFLKYSKNVQLHLGGVYHDMTQFDLPLVQNENTQAFMNVFPKVEVFQLIFNGECKDYGRNIKYVQLPDQNYSGIEKLKFYKDVRDAMTEENKLFP
jgi:hypothetical protein